MKIKVLVISRTGEIKTKFVKSRSESFAYKGNTYILDSQKFLNRGIQKIAIFKEGILKQLNFFEIKEELGANQVSSQELNILFRKNFLGQIKPKATPLEVVTILICVITVFSMISAVVQIQKVEKNTDLLVQDWNTYLITELNPIMTSLINGTSSTNILSLCSENIPCLAR